MSFDEVRLPVTIERNSAGGPGFLTHISALNSGKEQRNQLWSLDRGQWDIGYGIQTRAQALAVRDFFMARRGRARGFRFRDWSNYTSLNSETGLHVQQPTTEEADGSEMTFQMQFRYIDSGGFFYEKPIKKPVVDTIRVYVDGIEQEEDYDWDLDYTTGQIVFHSAPAYGSDITWTGEFDLPVRFDTDQLDIVVTTKEVLSQPSISIVELKL